MINRYWWHDVHLSVWPISLSAAADSSLQAALHQSVFLSAMSAAPGRDLTLCLEQHRKLLPGVARETAQTVQHWSVQQVSTWHNLSVACSLSLSLFPPSLALSLFRPPFLSLTPFSLSHFLSLAFSLPPLLCRSPLPLSSPLPLALSLYLSHWPGSVWLLLLTCIVVVKTT